MIIRNYALPTTTYTQKELEQTNTNTEAEETENLLEKELKEISLGDSCDCDCIDGIDNDTYTSLVKKLKQLELDVLPRHVKQNVAKELQEQYQQAKIKNPCNCDCHNKAADLAEQLNNEENSDLKNALDKVKEENSFFNKDNWIDEIKNKAKDKAKDLAEQLNSEENKKNEQQKDENQHVIPNALRPKINRNNKNLFLR